MEEIADSTLLHLNERFLQGYSQTKTFLDRVRYLRPILQPALDLRHSTSRGSPSFKREESAAGLRAEGNAFFRARELPQALTFYTMSLAAAPPGSPSLALAFANRAAVLGALGHHRDCLEDLRHALRHDYPRELRTKLWLRAARSQRALGDHRGAAQSLRRAEEAKGGPELTSGKEITNDLLELKPNLDPPELRTSKEVTNDLPELGPSKELTNDPLELGPSKDLPELGPSKELTNDPLELGPSKELTNDPLELRPSKEVTNDLLELGPSKELTNDLPELSYGPNKELPNLSSAVKLERSENLGRHLVATRDIEIGDVLLVERPFAALPESEFRWSHCSHCLGRSRASVPCPGCDWALFCSEACLRSSHSYHGTECAVVSRYCGVLAGPGAQYVLLLARIACVAGVTDLRLGPVLELASHERSVPEGVQDCLEVLNLTRCFDLPAGTDEDRLAATLLHVLTSLYVNVHGVVETQLASPHTHEDGAVVLAQTGLGIFPASALANHACDPNVFATFHGSTRVLRAARPLARGDHLWDNYGQLFSTAPRSQRQDYLRARYHVECACAACVHEWPEVEELPFWPQFREDERALQSDLRQWQARGGGALLTPPEAITVRELLRRLDGKRLNQSFLLLQQDLVNHFRSLGSCHVLY